MYNWQMAFQEWRARAFSTQALKRRDVELAITPVYKMLSGRTPWFVWCEGPFQLLLLPPVFIAIAKSELWRTLSSELREELNFLDPSEDPLWAMWWQRILSNIIEPVMACIEEHINWPSNKDELIHLCLNQLEKELYRRLLHEKSCLDDRLSNRLAKLHNLTKTTERFEFDTVVSPLQGLMRNSLYRRIFEIEYRQHVELPKVQEITEATVDLNLNVFWPFEQTLTHCLIDVLKLSDSQKRQVSDKQRHDEAVRLGFTHPTSPSTSPFDISPLLYNIMHPISKSGFIAQCEAITGSGSFAYENFLPTKTSREYWTAIWHDYLTVKQFVESTYMCRLLDDICFSCDQPLAYRFDERQRLHSANAAKPAISFRDGFSAHAWHGVRVPRSAIEQPERITTNEIENERNLEVRRALIELYGPSRFLFDSGASVRHEDRYGVLYEKQLPTCNRRVPGVDGWTREWRLPIHVDEPFVMVRVVNSTPECDGTFKEYFLWVPPTMQRAKQAIAWTFGLEEDEYNPAMET